MKPTDPRDQKTLRFHGAARVSFAFGIIALVLGTVCIMGGQWGPGLILVFAAVAGVMTAWQVRSRMRLPSTALIVATKTPHSKQPHQHSKD